jgi:hypothetical protein
MKRVLSDAAVRLPKRQKKYSGESQGRVQQEDRASHSSIIDYQLSAVKLNRILVCQGVGLKVSQC